ncbi:ankyrin repeat domain-containing protein [Flavobacterium johnsoniae]|uniref:ankyrin repeat domain-containing protein n=1 Tax=Flavobacterium johnsoniae TaxID=986 RepID=UPI0025B05BA1|nr:ankyrin repeat domain-containing protein [Flavobacterium johnsoniae]WJS95695.1 ankyrin repeat domain-containing protein [Flavobacterium johnsoniae]
MIRIEELSRILFNSNFIEFKETLTDYNILEVDNFGNNILHCYIKESENLKMSYKDVIDIILSKGLNINQKQSKGNFKRSPLHLAVFMKLENIVNYLIELGADVNSTDANGNSIIWTAVMFYRDQNGFFIEKLIKSGANINLENNNGISAFCLANSISNSDVKKFFK